MSTPSLELWNAAADSPFSPIIGKSLHSPVAFVLLAIGSVLTIAFSINKSLALAPLIAIPASIAFGVGSVYAMAAGGVDGWVLHASRYSSDQELRRALADDTFFAKIRGIRTVPKFNMVLTREYPENGFHNLGRHATEI